jgi:hypothetical protein
MSTKVARAKGRGFVDAPMLEDMGVSYNQSAQRQRLAALPKD